MRIFAVAKCHYFSYPPLFLDSMGYIYEKNAKLSKGNFPSHGLRPTNIPQTHKCLNYN